LIVSVSRAREERSDVEHYLRALMTDAFSIEQRNALTAHEADQERTAEAMGR
jgi:hypothetical protein